MTVETIARHAFVGTDEDGPCEQDDCRLSREHPCHGRAEPLRIAVAPAARTLGRPSAAAGVARASPRTSLRLNLMTAREVVDLPTPTGEGELLGSLVRRGDRIVAGAATGHGKTTFGLAAVRAITTRSTLLDWQGTGGRGLVIDTEQGLRTIQRRLREAGLNHSEDVDYLRAPDGLSLDGDREQVEQLEEVIAAGGYAIVLADPLYKLHRGDSNDERAAVDLMRLFDRWREAYGFALFLPVHTRKTPPGARFTINEFFGSSAYTRGAEVVVGLQLVRPGYSRLHFFKDRDGDLPVSEAWGLLFDREQGYRRDPNDGRKETAADKVRGLLATDPGMTLEQLMTATGYAERTMRGALRQLGAQDRSGPHNLKLWHLPEEAEP